MKKALIIVGGLLLAVALILVIGRQVAIGYLTPDFLVREIESRWKCRAHIESVDVRIFGDATVELEGVALGKRDVHARKQTPLADRPALENAEISCETVLLKVKPLPLIARRLDIRHLAINGAYLETAIRRTGKLSVERLFEEPGGRAEDRIGEVAVDGGAASGAQIGAGAGALIGEGRQGEVVGVAVTASESESDEEKFNAVNLPVAMAADRVEINNGSASIVIDVSGAHVAFQDLQLALTEIDVDPNDLVTRNRLAFVLESDLVVRPKEGPGEYVRADLSGVGTVRPFDPVTGELDPVVGSDLTIHGGSKLDTLPIVAKIKDLLGKVDTAGIKLDDFTLGGELQADAHTRIAYEQPMLRLEQPLTIELPETTLVINAETWMDTSTNQHEMNGAIRASDALTEKIEGMVDAYLKEKAGGFASEGLRDTVLNPLKVNDRVAVEVISRGDLSDPETDIITPLGNLTDVIESGKMLKDSLKDSLKEAGKNLLRGFLGGGEEKPPE